ncbi:hypothetical protein AeRB84_018700 [Aphanomyces euteiches]|nr:hypothetical protein AeRB84_018700 [Aphanomyces euteiches]
MTNPANNANTPPDADPQADKPAGQEPPQAETDSTDDDDVEATTQFSLRPKRHQTNPLHPTEFRTSKQTARRKTSETRSTCISHPSPITGFQAPVMKPPPALWHKDRIELRQD